MNDVQRITGKSERSARRLVNKVKAELGKERHHFITAEEFSSCTGIPLDAIKEYIND